MHKAGRAGHAQSFAQERGLLAVALDQMHLAVDVRQRAGNSDPGKTAAAAEVDPGADVRGDGEQLQGVGDVPGPEVGQGGGGDEIRFGLPLQQEVDEGVEPLDCFT